MSRGDRSPELTSATPRDLSETLEHPEGSRVNFAELGDHLIIVANLISASSGRVLKRGQRREQTAREQEGKHLTC